MTDSRRHDEPRDRLIDQGLHEILGDESPPDLLEQILTAQKTAGESEVVMSYDHLNTRQQHSTRMRWIARLVVTAALLMVAALIGKSYLDRQVADRKISEAQAQEFYKRRIDLKSDPTRQEAASKVSSMSSAIETQPGKDSRPASVGQDGSELTVRTDSDFSGPGDIDQVELLRESTRGELYKQLDNSGPESTPQPVALGGMEGREGEFRGGEDDVLDGYAVDGRGGYAGGETSSESKLYSSNESNTSRVIPLPGSRVSGQNYGGGGMGGRGMGGRGIGGGGLGGRGGVRFEQLSARGTSRRGRVYRDREFGDFGIHGESRFSGDGAEPYFPGDQYSRIQENKFIATKGTDAISTFSIDVDTASYANVRQFLMQSQALPPADAVRIEELINYFKYDYDGPKDEHPFAAHVETATCPWQPKHRLVRVALKGREPKADKPRPLSNLVFLVDVSGSMNNPNKLPLVIHGLKRMAEELTENDRVAIVVYASSEGLALPSTTGDQRQVILDALSRLRAGGSTAGGAGINLAYKIAEEYFIEGGINRVILCTDGDFNVGVTSTSELEALAERKAKETGVFLTALGFGRGNLNDAMMESITNKGNGNYHYIDTEREAQKVLIEEVAGTLVTIAKDVKIQIEFNPAYAASYRLIGYENRVMAREDFNDDTKDAGEIGAGHTVTALYEIVPAGAPVAAPKAEKLKYQPDPSTAADDSNDEFGEDSAPVEPVSDELLTIRLRYKKPDGDTSTKVEFPVKNRKQNFSDASRDFQLAATAASFGMMLRNSKHKGNASWDNVLELAEGAINEDSDQYRTEFIEMIKRARQLTGGDL